ncbi:MAG: GNAT family N-acetyltransferase [Chloroflexales bacterium]|nr:GNAT family N-acetyltransferase [Chloroflexales bacterium]
MVTIRTIQESDAEAFLDLCLRLDVETAFMMLEPGERMRDVAAQRTRIADILASNNQTLLLAEHARALVGYLSARGGTCRRNRHSVHLVIGILQAFTGQGLGARLFAVLEDWAHERGLHRLELTVMVHNTAAIGLYHKLGFVIEGTRKDSLLVNGAYVDEYAMAKLL